MAVSAGDAYLDVHARLAGDTGRKLAGQLQGPVSRAGEEAGRHFGKKFAAGLAIGAAAIGVGLVRATGAAVRGIQAATDKASDLNETINKVNVIFGKNATTIQKWSQGSARNLGLSRQEALSSAAAFGDMFLQLKLGQPQAVRMSKGMVTLASDLASFSNADITQVLEAQQSAFRGEYDALQRFIPNINAARVEQEALAATHKKSAKELTAAEKAQAVYSIMMKDSVRAQGDFLKTSRDLANVRRIEKGQWEDLQAAIGKRFLPAQLAVHRALSDKLLPALGVLVKTYGPAVERAATRWATRFAAVIPSTRQLQLGLRALGEAFQGNGVTTSADSFVGKMERLGVTARRVIDWFKRLGPEFAQMRGSAAQLGPALSQAGGGGKLFADSLGIVAPVLDIVARNMHNILPWLPTILAGFLAFRGVRTAIAPVRDIGQAIANFASPALALATWANARASRALAEAYREQAVAAMAAAGANERLTATNAGTAASAGGAASKLGLLGAVGAAVGTALFTGADAVRAFKQGTLDARDPVTLLVDKVFGLKLGLVDTGEAQRGNTAATRTAATVADRHAAAVRGEHDAVTALKDALRGEESAELDVRQAKLSVSSAQRRLTDLTRGGKKGSDEYKQAQIDLRRAQIDLKARTEEYKGAQIRANNTQRDARRAALQAAPPLDKLGERARVAGIRMYTSGTKAREGMGIAGKSVKGFQSTINSLHGKRVDIVARAAVEIANSVRSYLKAASVPGFHATGGPIRGPGTGTSDSIPAMLSAGEHVWTAKEVQKAGGHGAVEQMRQQVRGYASGGPIVDVRVKTSDQNSRVGQFYSKTVEATRRIGELVAKGMADKIGKGLAKAIEKGIMGGSAGIKAFIHSVDRLPYRWGAAGPGAYDCSGLVGAVYGKMRGDRRAGHGTRYFTTGSINAGTPGLKSGLGGLLNIGVTSGIGHMAGSYGGLGFEARSTRTGIFTGAAARSPASFARRYHMAGGGKVDGLTLRQLMRLGVDVGGDEGGVRLAVGQTFDRGGWLMPGTTVAHNRTGQAERVLPPGDSAINLTVNVHNHGPILGSPQAFAREATATVRSELKSQLRREGKTALANQL